MKKKIDTDYILEISFVYFKSHTFYEAFKSEIDSNGSMSMIRQKDNYKVKIFTPELMIILDSEKLPVFNRDLQKNTIINGLIFTDSYFEGFHEGEQYFENHFALNVNTLYGENAKPYIKNLHNNLIHTVHHSPYKGWNFVLKSVPTVLNNKNIKVFGYYSGIVSKVQELVKIHKALINVYDNCEHEIINVTATLKVSQIALIHVYENQQITRENARSIAAQYGYCAKNSGEGLFQDYTKYSSAANRKGEPTPFTALKLTNKIKLFESVVEHLSDNIKPRAIDEINILKSLFQS